MRKNIMLTSLAMMAMMAETSFGEIPKESKRKYEPRKEPKKTIPKGCKEYHFTRSGHYDVQGNTWNDIDYIFSCIATNDKSAIKKYNSFIKNEKSPK